MVALRMAVVALVVLEVCVRVQPSQLLPELNTPLRLAEEEQAAQHQVPEMQAVRIPHLAPSLQTEVVKALVAVLLQQAPVALAAVVLIQTPERLGILHQQVLLKETLAGMVMALLQIMVAAAVAVQAREVVMDLQLPQALEEMARHHLFPAHLLLMQAVVAVAYIRQPMAAQAARAVVALEKVSEQQV